MRKIIITGVALIIASTSAFATNANTNAKASTKAKTNTTTKKTSDQDAQLAVLQKELDQLQIKMSELKKNVKVTKAPAVTVSKPNNVSSNSFGNYVVVAPYTGRDNYGNGSTLLVNAPTVNEDLDLLKRRATENAYLISQGLSLPNTPRLVLSGQVAAKTWWQSNFTGASTSDIDLDSAELDVFAQVSNWVNGFMAINFDNNVGTINYRENAGSRLNDSNIKLDRGFITIGDISRSPFYGSAGQMIVPFGRYNSSMIVDPMTHLGKTKARAISASFAPLSWGTVTPYASAFVYNGDSKYGNSGIVKEGGGDAGINFKKGKANGNLGASYIRNLADSLNMQDNSSSTENQFQGFSKNSASEQIHHAVGGVDLYGNIGYGPFNLLGEYLTALQEFTEQDMSFNSHGAKIQALNVEGSYTFFVFKLPSSFTLGYGRSFQALALLYPEQRYDAAFIISPLRDTSLELEYQHNLDYAKTDTANGAVQDGNAAFNGTGSTDNVITAKFSVYF